MNPLSSLHAPLPAVALLLGWCSAAWSPCGVAADGVELRREFTQVVRPFLTTYCLDCHGEKDPEAKFDLSPYQSLESVVRELGHWEIVLQRLRAGEMPPEDAAKHPDANSRAQMIDWIERLRQHESQKHAGDPGPVLARRLNNAEYDYSIHDLTGFDIRPTREFPVDPASEAGFDNSGESLTMSSALLNKYLAAARQVADHLVFLPDRLDFAPHPMVVYSDRDKYAVHRIVDFYRQQPVDHAQYFLAAWRFRHRAVLGRADATLEDIAAEAGVSAKYLNTLVCLLMDDADDAGPIAELRDKWNRLAEPHGAEDTSLVSVTEACAELREWIGEQRSTYRVPIGNLNWEGLHASSQPLILWKDREIAARRQLGRLPESDGTEERERLRAAISRFCLVFPDTFVVSERGRMFLPPKEQEKGRLLSAGFHLMVGYFRDDGPLYDLILEPAQQEQLDRLWRELDFVTHTPVRQFVDFIYFERAEKPAFLQDPEFDFAREDADITSEPKLRKLATLYLEKVRAAGYDDEILEVVGGYFDDMSASIRQLEQALDEAEPRHLESLWTLASRAWRQPLTDAERSELLAFYRQLREQEKLTHEDAVRDTLVSILMSPQFGYRLMATGPGSQPRPLTNHELASRLSYFLWSSLPDEELIEHAAAGDLHDPEVLARQTQRMLRDPRIRRLATEFFGNWLDFRRFELHQGVNRDRFPSFTPELRQAMYEEPIRFLTDLIQRSGSVLELIEARHTFVNPLLAAHYGLPVSAEATDEWMRVEDADQFGRGGMLPMSVFLTYNSPGLRTSPVKRGYWVVRRLVGEPIPAPPPEVPELPEDESELGDLSLRDVLAKHREIKSCAACHRKFDSIGMVFEGYGPIGERRHVDLGGRAVDDAAEFPNGSTGVGLAGLQRYLREARQEEFLDNLCRKFLSYALGRSLLLSDETTIQRMKDRLVAEEYRFDSLVETVVSSPQFLQKRGRDFATGAEIE